MKGDPRLKVLADLAAMLKERSLEELRAAAARREATRERIAGLNVPPAEDLPLVAAAQANLTYQRWADQRRRELNMQLARETVEWMGCQEDARLAFGKSEVLRKLRDTRK
ncbi:hypothetical protein [Gemmobacter denitrificans]|uniref:Uncharacterized protein n=1 Tax=Gemmobacter denitrificans TaxID=3123040 RepID=A0ABU8BVD4_9RHOB